MIIRLICERHWNNESAYEMNVNTAMITQIILYKHVNMYRNLLSWCYIRADVQERIYSVK